MSQNGWVKPDFAKGCEGNDFPKKNTTECSTAPTNSSELVVQKKKVAEVKHWLEQAFSTAHQAQFLLLTGPPGCGKYQTLSVLCNELNIEILTWEEPMKHFESNEWDYGKYNPHHHTEAKQTDVNFYDHLEEFLERANRFSTLKMKSTKCSAAHKSSEIRKILLLKDFPPMIFKNLERWHNILLKYSSKKRTPAVFILTSTKSYKSTQLKLFPAALSERLMMSTINFSGLANTFVLKALQRVALKSQQPFSEVIEGIVESSNGDLRSALNVMHWITTSNVNVKKPHIYSKKRKLASDVKKDSLNAIYVRDGSLDFMHAIGKILHSKRLTQVQEKVPDLPKHLLEESRLPLKENVNELIKSIDEAPSKVLLYLHQNYLFFFNKIEDASKAIEYLSSADSLGNQLVYKEIFDECSLLTSVLGLLFSNTSVNGNAWRPLRKPDHYSVLLKQQELQAHTQELYRQSGSSFFSEILPFINLIKPGGKNATALSVNYQFQESRQSAFLSGNAMVPQNLVVIPDKNLDDDIIIEDYDD